MPEPKAGAVEATPSACPFKHTVAQGSRADDYEPYADDSLSEDSNWCVICPVCKAASGFYETVNEAVVAWNARVSLEAKLC